MKPMNVLGVASSMRESSYGTRTLRIVLDAVQKYEAKTRLLDLRRVTMPMYNPDSDSYMPLIRKYRR